MKEKKVKLDTAAITRKMIDEMQAKLGTKLRIDDSVHNEYATRMAILKFSHGIGDKNPLWTDETYAGKSPYGGIVAPPSFIWACFAQVQFGWRGLGGFHAGCDVEFSKPIYLGDKITAECVYTIFEGPKKSSFAEETVIDHFHNQYWNQRRELVAKYHWWVVRYSRAKTQQKAKRNRIELPHPWTDEQLAKIEEEVASEEIRGNAKRYWEDTKIGEELSPVTKGPLGITDEIAYIIGGGVPIPRITAHGVALATYRKHPTWAFRDPNTHALEPIFAVHYNKQAANAMGLPQAYDVGLQRHCWGVHLITNWMGDDAWLKRSYAEYRKFVYLSDVVCLKGKVTKKYIDSEGDYCVEIERHAINQRGEDVMPGYAIVALPSKNNKIPPLEKYLEK
ncbi:MAG: MaoC family dehydratase N-terminal domain-containing protein [Dehalococcoidales bacterium]